MRPPLVTLLAMTIQAEGQKMKRNTTPQKRKGKYVLYGTQRAIANGPHRCGAMVKIQPTYLGLMEQIFLAIGAHPSYFM